MVVEELYPPYYILVHVQAQATCTVQTLLISIYIYQNDLN